MKSKIRNIIMGLAVALCALSTSYVGAQVKEDIYLAAESTMKSYVFIEENVPVIFKNWNKDLLIKNMSPEFRDQMNNSELKTKVDGVWAMLKMNLGNMKECYGVTSQSINLVIIDESRVAIVSKFTVEVEFEKGNAVITLDLMKTGSDWGIYHFDVNSPANVPNSNG